MYVQPCVLWCFCSEQGACFLLPGIISSSLAFFALSLLASFQFVSFLTSFFLCFLAVLPPCFLPCSLLSAFSCFLPCKVLFLLVTSCANCTTKTKQGSEVWRTKAKKLTSSHTESKEAEKATKEKPEKQWRKTRKAQKQKESKLNPKTKSWKNRL